MCAQFCRMETVLKDGGIVLVEELTEATISVAKDVARQQGRALYQGKQIAAQLRKPKWPYVFVVMPHLLNLPCSFATARKMLLFTVCSVLILDCAEVSKTVVNNCLKAAAGKAHAPMIIVCPAHMAVFQRLQETASLTVRKRKTVVQMKFGLTPAVILACVWVLERCGRLSGEASGRPNNAALMDVSSSCLKVPTV